VTAAAEVILTLLLLLETESFEESVVEWRVCGVDGDDVGVREKRDLLLLLF